MDHESNEPIRPNKTMPEAAAASPSPAVVPAPHQPEEIEWRQPPELVIREIVETLLLTLLIFWLVNAFIGRYRIEGPSMQPTLWQGEYLIINKFSYYLEEPTRGDIIVFQHPNNSGTNLIKRIIGLPGDHVTVHDQVVTVNGVTLNEPYINAAPAYEGEWDVPEDSYFVLGDNRNNSSDSHTWNYVPHDNLEGKALLILWPVDKWQYVPHYQHQIN